MNIVEPIRKKEYIKQVEDYLAKTSKRNRLIFAFGINTGLRVSDILALNISDIGISQEEIDNSYANFEL